MTRANSIGFDGLQILNDGLVICDPVSNLNPCPEGSVDMTPRARAFAKFMQGWTWGYLGMVFDNAHVVPEDTDIPTDADPSALTQIAVNTLVPSEEVIAASIGALEEAIQIAQQNPDVVDFPSEAESSFWFRAAEPVTNTQFIQMANTLAARILILSARTPAERAALDWNRILQFTQNGLTEATGSYARALNSGQNRDSTFLLELQRNGTTTIWNTRWNYRTIGMADQSGAYQAWIAASLDQRDRFDIVTPDRRITGDTPTSNGTYTVYREDNNGFAVERGTYRFSAYQWGRKWLGDGLSGSGNTVGHNTGSGAVLIGVDENTLYRAEALLRTGNAQGAADLINITRTRVHLGQSLPAVTPAGVPTVGGACVPRQDGGACGTLYDALRYERLIELAGIDPFRGYMDARGFGMLPDGSLLEWPVPGNALELYGLENYTYGGVGNPNTATYAPVSNP
jgi:hypothetical protein